MKTILQVNTSILSNEGQSTRLANEFVAKFRTDEKLVVRDLARDPVPHLDAERFGAFIAKPETRTLQQDAFVAYSDGLINELKQANVIVLGDINDFEFSETTRILEGGELHSLVPLLPNAERYSYVFEGNSQVLDQILFSENALRGLSEFDVVHVNAEFHDQASDHDPSVARLKPLGGGGGGNT